MVDVRQLKDGCKLEDREQGISARLNGEGLWCSFRNGPFFYRRCMDGTVVIGADAMPISSDEAKAVHRHFHQWIKSVPLNDAATIKSQSLSVDCYDEKKALYQQAYPEEVCILPPERYGDIVIQPAIGCPNRKCTFCAFYKEKPYQVLNEQAFISHLVAVRQFYGEKLVAAQGVFLGSANAMALSQRRLMFCLEQIKERFGVFKREVATFSDPDYSARRSSREWDELRDSGLKHIVIGLETGWGELRGALGKSGDLSRVRDTINSAKQSGITIGLTVLTGIAPEVKREMNLVNTLATIKDFDLSAKDTIYLSPLSDSGHIKVEAVAEQRLFAESLRDITEARVIPYQMQRFQYFS